MRIRKTQPLHGVHKFTLIFTVAMCLHVLTKANAQNGFLSIDCGSTVANYNDSLGLTWVTDNGTYTKTGNTFEQSYVNWTFLNSSAGAGNQALQSYRYFPERRSKHCYELESKSNTSFLIRASFYLNAYELRERQPFQFLTYINATEWFEVSSGDDDSQSDMFVSQESIFTSPGEVIYFCLVPVFGVPFISSLELRQLEPTMYAYSRSQLQFLPLFFRYNMGPNTSTPEIVRFPDDSYDRIWQRAPLSNPTIGSFSNSTRANQNLTGPEVNYVPSKVMQDCWLIFPSYQSPFQRPSFDIYTPQVSLTGSEYAYTLAYAENLNSSILVPFEMDISFDYDTDLYTGSGPIYGPTVTVSNQASMQAAPDLRLSGSEIEVLLSFPSGSTQEGSLPLNAFEAYSQLNYNFSITNPSTVEALSVLQSKFSLTDWQGDPCVPVPYDWISCACSPCDERGQGRLLTGYAIISLTLSNLTASAVSSLFKIDDDLYNLQGLVNLETISITHSEVNSSAFAVIANLFLETVYLDLSFNAIGVIPPASDWYLNFLIFLNLSHNHLTKLDPFENEVFQTTLNIL